MSSRSDQSRGYAFLVLSTFVSAWAKMGLDDGDQRTLENDLGRAPERHPIEPGTGGLRKARFSPASWNVGDRGGIRVHYLYLPDTAFIVLVFAYPKTRQAKLSQREKAAIRALVAEIRPMIDRQTPKQE